jgi:hypothetical protein
MRCRAFASVLTSMPGMDGVQNGQGGARPRGQNGIGAEPPAEKPLARRRAATIISLDDSTPRF